MTPQQLSATPFVMDKPFLAVAFVAGMFLALGLSRWILLRRRQEPAEASKEPGGGGNALVEDDHAERKRFARQLTMLGLTALAGVVAIIVLFWGDPELQRTLFTFCGILLSAVLGISSTTFISNAMAGLLLRHLRNFRNGDWISVGDYFGKVTERGLFHTEINTEDRDLITLPNLYVATNAVRVVRTSGTVVSTTLSLGYDLSRARVETLLKQAAEDAKLQAPIFVHVTELGDFSVTYRIAGLLTDTKQLLTARSDLRKTVLDCLHNDGIEIVSPTFMNQRQLDPDRTFLPARERTAKPALEADDEAADVIFDKAHEAEAKESLQFERERIAATTEEMKKSLRASKEDGERAELEAKIKEAEDRLGEIDQEIATQAGAGEK